MNRRFFGLLCALLLAFALARGAPAEEKTAEVAAPLALSVTVTYMDAWGSVFFEDVLREGQPIHGPPGTPWREGFDFLYWYDPGWSDGVPFGFGAAAERDQVLWPFFEERSPVVQPVTPSKAGSNSNDQGEDEDGDGKGGKNRPPAQREPEKEEEKPGSGGPGTVIIDDTKDPGDEYAPFEPPIGNVHWPKEPSIQISSATGGGNVTLTAQLIGFDERDVELRWQYESHVAGEWVDAPGGTATTYSFAVAPETVNRTWRLVAIITK